LGEIVESMSTQERYLGGMARAWFSLYDGEGDRVRHFGVSAMTPPESAAEMPAPILHLSRVVKRPLVDGTGERMGRVEDLIVRVGEHPHPPIVGAVVRMGGRDLFVPISKIADLEDGQVRFEDGRVDLRHFERRPGELLLSKDLLARHLINLVGGRVISAKEIELAKVNGIWEVVGVDPSGRPALRRLLPGKMGRHIPAGGMVDWASIEPFVAHVPTARLHIPYRKLARLHPAQIADLVEAASHEEGEEIITAVKADSELEADVFEELDIGHQAEFVRSRSDADTARLLSRMASDDAADLIMELGQERRMPVLDLLPAPQQLKVRSLLSYHPETAGGLMSPEFVALPEQATVDEALSAIRHSAAPLETLQVVFSLDERGGVTGSAPLVSLIRAEASDRLASVVHVVSAHVHADWDLHAVVRKMSDFNLTVAPVMDAEHHSILGVVTVDDVLELLLPSGWRRDAGTTAAEE
jgi:CBS domain-containing protein